jgi:hypothetical protein
LMLLPWSNIVVELTNKTKAFITPCPAYYPILKSAYFA